MSTADTGRVAASNSAPGVIGRKWATARAWRHVFASEASWLAACFLHMCGRASWARRLPAVKLRMVGDPRPLWLRPGSSDFATFREIFIDREYDVVHAFAASPAGVLDLGANIGLTARWLRQQFPSVRVMCVEPDGRNAHRAAANLAAAVASGEVVIMQAFAGGTSRAAWIDSPGRGLTNEHRLSDRPRRAATTPVYTVGELLARCPFPVDTVKMDVEGSEREIFAGDLSWLNVVRDVLVEVHAPLDEHWLRSVLPAGGPAHVRKVFHRHPGAFLAWVTCRP